MVYLPSPKVNGIGLPTLAGIQWSHSLSKLLNACLRYIYIYIYNIYIYMCNIIQRPKIWWNTNWFLWTFPLSNPWRIACQSSGVQMGGTKENCKEHTNYHPKSKPTEIDGKNRTNPLKELYRIKNSSPLSNLTSNSSSPSSGWTPPSSSNTVALLEVPSKLATAMRSPAATENPYFRYSGWNATILHCHRCYPWYDHWQTTGGNF